MQRSVGVEECRVMWREGTVMKWYGVIYTHKQTDELMNALVVRREVLYGYIICAVSMVGRRTCFDTFLSVCLSVCAVCFGDSPALFLCFFLCFLLFFTTLLRRQAGASLSLRRFWLLLLRLLLLH